MLPSSTLSSPSSSSSRRPWLASCQKKPETSGSCCPCWRHSGACSHCCCWPSRPHVMSPSIQSTSSGDWVAANLEIKHDSRSWCCTGSSRWSWLGMVILVGNGDPGWEWWSWLDYVILVKFRWSWLGMVTLGRYGDPGEVWWSWVGVVIPVV